ncbi:hypothetical protein L596_001175 [Steinernema carpocapsae]|uniref:Uncharacterized protein n=1 Tax=Steinernema carpocapsae TaxID=34508 RepID=A0A4V6I710_STECR|nr:hypothetical protein L596_001175 [Steinernema carpocapsae]
MTVRGSNRALTEVQNAGTDEIEMPNEHLTFTVWFADRFGTHGATAAVEFTFASRGLPLIFGFDGWGMVVYELEACFGRFCRFLAFSQTKIGILAARRCPKLLKSCASRWA